MSILVQSPPVQSVSLLSFGTLEVQCLTLKDVGSSTKRQTVVVVDVVVVVVVVIIIIIII